MLTVFLVQKEQRQGELIKNECGNHKKKISRHIPQL